MFLTACAPNPLVADFVRHGSPARLTWTTWALAASVPGAIAVAVDSVSRLSAGAAEPSRYHCGADARRRSARRDGADVEARARHADRLHAWCWRSGSPATGSRSRRRPSALAGVALLLLSRRPRLADIVDERSGWDVFVWFGGLMMLAAQLEKAGFPKAFAQALAGLVHGWPWMWALVLMLCRLRLRALRVREPGGARHGDVPGVLRRRRSRSARRRSSPPSPSASCRTSTRR